MENYTNKKNTGYLVKSTNASNVFYIVLAFRFVITEIAFTMIKRIILVLETIRLVLSSKLNANLDIEIMRLYPGNMGIETIKTKTK